MKSSITLIWTAASFLTVSGCASRWSEWFSSRDSAVDLRDDDPAALGAARGELSLDDHQAIFYEPWEFSGQQGLLIITPHYRLYTTVNREDVLARLPIFFERALDHYVTALADLPRPDVPLETYLFQTRRQWREKTQEMLPDQAQTFINLGRGGFTTRGTSVLYFIDRWGMHDTLALAAHEGWHQYTQRTLKHQLPIWLEEGIATYMEGYRDDEDGLHFDPEANAERRATLTQALRDDRLIEMPDLLERTPQSFLNESKDRLLVYYAQVWALTRFLFEGEDGRYRTALATLLTDAAEGRYVGRMGTSTVLPRRQRTAALGPGRIGPAVVMEYFNPDVGEFNAQYEAYMKAIEQETPERTSTWPGRRSDR